MIEEFIILNDHKQAIHSFKNGGKSWDQVEDQENIARIVPYPFIVLDFDTESDSQKMLQIIKEKDLKCSVMKTTRGIYVYFRSEDPWKCFTKERLACGLYADCKSHSKNAYTIIRQAGKDREWIQRIPEDQIERVPDYLRPVKAPDRFNFKMMSDGSGRNQELFNYIPFLVSKGFSRDQIIETIHIINDFVFKDPLPEGEIETILRDEAFELDLDQCFYQNKTLLHEKVGDFMISEYNIARLEDQIVIYDDGIYLGGRKGSELINLKLRELIHNLKKNQKAEILDYMRDVAPEINLSPARYIAFKNGIYDLTTGKLSDQSPRYVILNKIGWNYNERAYFEATDKTLDRIACGDPSIRLLIEEMIGYCFYRENILRKCFVLVGEKRNGKSTLLDVIEMILGVDNFSALDLKNVGDRFSKAQLYRKLANIGDDISDEFIPDPSLFKKIVSGNRIEAEFKGQNPFSFNPYCKLIFSTNGIPRIKDDSGAVHDRLIIIPFNASFQETDPDYDPHIKEKLQSEESIEYLIKLGMEGLKRILENKRFSSSEKVDQELKEYREFNNPILGFFADHDPDFLYENSRKSLYRMYRAYCDESGIRAESNQRFYKNVVRLFDVECYDTTREGVRDRFFRAKIE